MLEVLKRKIIEGKLLFYFTYFTRKFDFVIV